MSDQPIIPLGFDIDTGALGRAKQEAAGLAQAIGGVADAMGKQENAATKSAAAQNQNTTATKTSRDASQTFAQAVVEATRAIKAEEDAVKRAEKAARDKVKADKEAEEAARKHAEAERRKSDVLLRGVDALKGIGQQSATVGQHLRDLTQSTTMAAASFGTGPGGMVQGLGGMTQAAMRAAPALAAMGGAAAVATAGTAGLGLAFGAVVLATYKTEERFAVLEARLKNVYGSGALAAEMFGRIKELADSNAVSIDASAEAFLRLARNNEAIGLTRNKMVDLTDAVQKLGRISGASQGEISGGLMQFSQALAAGRLNGDELRSIMENLPALAKAIADGMGISVGQLRAMGAEGQLTGDKITGALLGQLPKIRKEFEGLPETSEQAFTRVGNAWGKLLDHMGQQANASAIMTGIGNMAASVINDAAEAMRPETTQEELDRTRKYREDLYDFGLYDSKIAQLEAQLEAERMLKRQGDAKEQRNVDRAPYVRAQPIMDEVDDLGTKRKKIEAQIRALEEPLRQFQGGLRVFEPEEIKRLERAPNQIAALKTQLEALRPVIEDYRRTTAQNILDMQRYGTGGAASLGEEARGLVKQAAGAGQNLGFDEAEAAVIARRTAELKKQTDAMVADVAAQQRLTDAIGGGVSAQIDAEVTTKALNLQMQLFGEDLTPQAASQIEKYKDGLRELLRAQRDVTDAQKDFNTQQEIGIQKAILAAKQQGLNAGELRALERGLRLQQGVTEAGGTVTGGVIPASRVDGNTVTTWMQADITATVAAVMQTYSGVNGISGLRPHDHGSQHATGKAFDLDISMLSEADKKQLVQELLSGKYGRVGGIGTYNDSATSLHIDTRDGRQAWGPNKSQTSLGQTPEWFETMTRDWMAGGGPSVATGSAPGVRAAMSEAELAALRAQSADQDRSNATSRDTGTAAALARARDAREAKRIRDEATARDYAAQFEPEQQQVAYAEKLAQIREQDNATVAEHLRQMDEQTSAMRDQAKIGGTASRQREIEKRTLEDINSLQAQGIELSEEDLRLIREKNAERVGAEFDLDQAEDDANAYKSVWEAAATGIGGALESAVRSAAKRGKIDAEELLTDLVADITSAILQAYITKPLTNAILGLAGVAAHGTATDGGGHTLAFAQGGVVNSPKLFAMAGGAGLMGEAGPEAVLPLKRGPDGRLGVGGGNSGGGVSVQVYDQRTASGSEPVEIKEGRGPDGSRQMQVYIRDEVGRQIKSGEQNSALKSVGVSRPPVRR